MRILILSALFVSASFAQSFKTIDISGKNIDLLRTKKNDIVSVINSADSINVKLGEDREINQQIINILNANLGDGGSSGGGGIGTGGLTVEDANNLLNGREVNLDLTNNNNLRDILLNNSGRGLRLGSGYGSGGFSVRPHSGSGYGSGG